MNTGTQYQPHLDNAQADLVIVGGGVAGVYLTEALQPYIGSTFRTLLLEQKELLGGDYDASLQQFRTFQGVEALSKTIAQTVSWYEALSQEIFAGAQSLISFFPYLFLAVTFGVNYAKQATSQSNQRKPTEPDAESC